MRVPYRTYDPARIATDFVLPLPAPARDKLVIAVIGDWGTGTRDARQLLAAVATHEPDMLLHLGDIYYSGTPAECRQHFYDVVIAQWPGAAGPAIPIYTLSGNHDLYAGGDGYYQLLDLLGQPASFFCLRDAHWQLLALDTGLHERDVRTADSCVTYLEPSEALWHQDKIRNAGGRKTILLSHHQLFSVVSGGVGRDGEGRPLAVNPNLYGMLSENGVTPRDISLWLWGHEHNLIVYEPYAGLARGRCIGAGAIPIGAEEDPYTPNPNLLLPPGHSALPRIKADVRLGHDDNIYNRCYTTITLAGATAKVDYYQYLVETDAGQLLYSETIG
jgi:DNA repair exonuclease SbcCD nuclease subunit